MLTWTQDIFATKVDIYSSGISLNDIIPLLVRGWELSNRHANLPLITNLQLLVITIFLFVPKAEYSVRLRGRPENCIYRPPREPVHITAAVHQRRWEIESNNLLPTFTMLLRTSSIKSTPSATFSS